MQIIIYFDSKTNAYLVLNKKFWKIPFKLSLKSSFSHIDSHNYIDEKPNKYTYDILNNNLGILSNFGESIFNFEFGYKNKQSYVSSKTIDTKSKLHLHQPYLNLFFDYLNFSLTVKSSIEFYRTSTLEKQLYTLSPNLSYKTKNKKWKFYIKGQDILNLNKNYIIENIAYNNYFEERTVSTIGGFMIAGLVYKF